MINKVKNNLIIITGSKNGLAKKIKKNLEKKYNVFSISKNDYDLSIYSDVIRLIRKLKKIIKFKKILFINNAATLGNIDRLGKLNNKKILQTVNLNFLTPFLLVNFFLKKLNVGYVNITSGSAFTYKDKLSLYSVTKLATFKLFKYIKKENNEIFVKNLNPGILKTNMNKVLIKEGILKKNMNHNNTQRVLNKISRICNNFFI
jgi:short-subunit dehydrogenase